MKLVKSLKKILNEALGVPDNLHEVSEQVYNEVLQFLKQNVDYYETLEDVGNLKFELYGPWQIADMTIQIIEMSITFMDYKEPALAKMHFNAKQNISIPNVVSNVGEEIRIGIDFAGPEDEYVGQVIDYFENQKPKMVSFLSHELKHAYDFHKKGEHKIEKYVEYAASQKNIVNIGILVDFLFYNYYLHEFENAVRPSEIYSYLRSIGTTKESFLKDFKQSEIVKQLDICRKLTYDQFLDELYQNISTIYGILKDRQNTVDFDMKTDQDSLIQFFLYLVRTRMLNIQAEIMAQLVTPDPNDIIRIMMGGGSFQNEEFFKNFVRKITSGQRYFETNFNKEQSANLNEEFFEKKIKTLNFNAEKMFRKLAKIYDLLPSVNDTKQSLNKKINMKVQSEEKTFEFVTDEIGTKEYVDTRAKQGKIKTQLNTEFVREFLKKKEN